MGNSPRGIDGMFPIVQSRGINQRGVTLGSANALEIV